MCKFRKFIAALLCIPFLVLAFPFVCLVLILDAWGKLAFLVKTRGGKCKRCGGSLIESEPPVDYVQYYRCSVCGDE